MSLVYTKLDITDPVCNSIGKMLVTKGSNSKPSTCKPLSRWDVTNTVADIKLSSGKYKIKNCHIPISIHNLGLDLNCSCMYYGIANQKCKKCYGNVTIECFKCRASPRDVCNVCYSGLYWGIHHQMIRQNITRLVILRDARIENEVPHRTLIIKKANDFEHDRNKKRKALVNIVLNEVNGTKFVMWNFYM